MQKEELINLVEEIVNVKGKTEEQISELIRILIKNVSYPQITDLIYFEDLTPEEIVDRALNYKPTLLLGSNLSSNDDGDS
jgi:hypothetical protein